MGQRTMMEWVVQALLTADKVIEERNGKKAIIGIFDRIHIDTFPGTGIPPWNIYTSIANLSEGEHNFAVNIVYNDTSAAIFGASGTLNVNDQDAMTEVVIPVSVVFPGPGAYTVSLHIDGDQCLSRIIRVWSASHQSRGA